MKIVTDKKVYVQKNDIAYLNQTDLPIPASIFMKVYGSGIVIIDDRNRYEFVEFTAPEEIEFFKKLDWMIDYNEVKDLSEEELIKLGENLNNRYNDIAIKYNAMSQEKRKENQHLVVEHELLGFKMCSLRDIILFKRGTLKINLPKGIETPIVKKQNSKKGNIENKNNEPKLFRSIFKKRKRN